LAKVLRIGGKILAGVGSGWWFNDKFSFMTVRGNLYPFVVFIYISSNICFGMWIDREVGKEEIALWEKLV
jgi:hypothetical protein